MHAIYMLYAFHSESTFHSYLNVKELLAQNRDDIWSLSDNGDSKPQPPSLYIQSFSQTGQMIELCCEYLSVGYIWLMLYHVTYLFQSESPLFSCLNVKVTATGFEPRTS